MNTLKANQHSQAVNQLSNLDGVQVPSTINVKEKDYYHVLIVESKPNMETMKFDHKVKTQVINQESFERNKDTYKQLGYSNMVVFHSPIIQRKLEAEEAAAKAEADRLAKEEEQKRIDEEAKKQAKAEAKAKADAEEAKKAEAAKKAKEAKEAKAKAAADKAQGTATAGKEANAAKDAAKDASTQGGK